MPLRIYKTVDSPCPKRCLRIPRHLPGSISASPAISCGIRPPLPPVGAGNSISDVQEPSHVANMFTHPVVYLTTDAMPSVTVGPLLDQVSGSLSSFTADGAYDQDGVYPNVTLKRR